MKSTQEHQAGLLICVSIKKGKKFNMNAFNGESVSGENALKDANCFF